MERDVVAAILLAWGAHPRLRLARINTGKARIRGRWVKFNPKGTGDIVGLIAPWGRMLMIECKSATGEQREAQVVMQRVVSAFGGLYVLARDLKTVDDALGALGIFRAV